MLLWSLGSNIVRLFGCFIDGVPVAKLIHYMNRIFMMTKYKHLINSLTGTNLSISTIEIFRDSVL